MSGSNSLKAGGQADVCSAGEARFGKKLHQTVENCVCVGV